MKIIQAINPFRKGTKLYSIARLRCPHCQEGNLFITKNPFNLKQFDKMPDRCAVCNEDFRREVGFYWGAMMISHASTTALGLLVHFGIYSIWGWHVWASIVTFITLLLILFPVIFRNSRAVWINFFVHYRKEARLPNAD